MSALKLAASNIGWGEADDDRVLRLMSNLGFVGLEVAPTRVFPDDPYGHGKEFGAYVHRTLSEYGLRPCSMQSIWRGRGENIFDEEGAASLLAHTKNALEFARAGSVRNVVFGCPRNRNMPEGTTQADAIPFLLQCADLAKERGCIFALEANPPIYGTNFVNSTAAAIELLQDMHFPEGLGINLDIGTILEMREEIDVVRRAGSLISHVHISEPGLVPVKARHVHSELRAVLEDLGYEGFISLEMATTSFPVVKGCLEYMAETFLS